MLQEQYESTLILDNERHLFIRLFKENDLSRKKIRPFRILSGSLHYFRVLPQSWPDRIEKMKKAGLNTIETYIPWNLHEPEMGTYKFTEGLTDLVSFLKLVHQHQMFTIIRPSGYICAEWEWGGLPSWLLQDDHMRVRSTHPNFLKALRNYYSILLPILSEHQYNRHGQGSIIAFQIENEYGGYGDDKNYLEAIRSIYSEYYLNELFFTSDNRFDLAKGALDDVWATVNFQRNVKENIDKLVEFRPMHHLMISEYWTGWFDYWGGTHQTGQNGEYSAKDFEQDLEEILLNSKYEISLNFYMFFGGTNFGFTSGGHHFPTAKYSPLVTSYDYDAPLSEAGDPTDKYFIIQNVIKKFYEQNPNLIIYNHERAIDDKFEIIKPSISKKGALGKINIYGSKTFEQILNDDILTKKYSVHNGPLNMEQVKAENQTIGDILVFFNEKNILKSPITLTNDHIKSEFIALRRHKKTVSIGICRCSDQALLTDTSIQHISSLTYDEFQKLSIDHSSTPSPNESRKSSTITDEILATTTDLKTVPIKHKAIIVQHKPLIHKRSTSPNRDSGYIETDGTNTSMLTDRSVISNSHTKHRSKASLEKSEDESTDTHKSLDSLQQSITKTTSEPIKKKPSGLIYSLQKRDKHVPNQTDLPVQTVTDACFIYRREVVKPDANTDDENSAIIQRGREIAYEAANTPAIPSSMPNYSRDQIRELYGELDNKTRRLQEDEYTLHSPMTPIESPASPKFDTNIHSMPPMTSNMVDSDSLVDLDDGTTTSYYSAKESRIDTTNHSTLSLGSDETISPLHQNLIRDDIINNFISPEDNYYFDALASPSHTNQQTSSSSSVTTAADKQNLLIDNLTNLLEEIETFNHTSHQLLSRVDEESSHLSHEEEESSNTIDRVITVIDDVHQYNQIESIDSMNNLLFVYDDIDAEQLDSSIDNLVEIVHTIHQAPVVINNLLFVYDETMTPSDSESKTILNGSNEWSYDNLMNHQDETDNLGFVVHEALTSKLQKPTTYEQTHGSEESTTDNSGFVVQEALTSKLQKPTKCEQTHESEESTTDNLGFVVHEALTSKLEKPPKYEQMHGNEESTTDNLGFVVQEALTSKLQKPTKYEQTHGNEELMIDNLGFVVQEAVTSKLQKPTKYEQTHGSEESTTDNLGFVVHEALTSKLQKPTKYEQTHGSEESTTDTDSLTALVHNVLSSKLQKPMKPVIYETVEPTAENDKRITVVDAAPTTNFKKLMTVKSTAELDQSVPREAYSEFIDDSLLDTSIPEDLEKSTDGYNQESISLNDEQTDGTHTSEILTYEIGQPNQQSTTFPVTNLFQIVSDSLLAGSNYHWNKNNFELNITHQPEYDEEIYEEYGYRRTTTDSSSNEIVDRHEELCRRYSSSCKQYQTTATKLDNEIDQFEKDLIEQKPQLPSPTSDVTSEELITTIERIVDMRDVSATNRNETDDYCSTITVRRQPDDYGKYGFDFEELYDGKIQISNILDENYCAFLTTRNLSKSPLVEESKYIGRV
ncbi:unnamed protein product [Rotaria magnacalcarata]|uniref:Glycoside hydrolase 35 catalytic domain-containing protein n=1 Tax=Rotaria magnacalcarata TaxID=392030 RepID=A0A8S2LK59_9BILA|nr:unnamed protein product [Rotaria magnacalcarata]